MGLTSKARYLRNESHGREMDKISSRQDMEVAAAVERERGRAI
jgi:hypothetical protein